MEHHAPHPRAAFEGYYSKLDLPSGAHLAIILCEVKGAKTRPYMVSFTYVPPDPASTYQKEVWADSMQMVSDSQSSGFVLNVPEIGFIKWNSDGSTEYDLQHETFTFRAIARDSTPWSKTTNTPESFLVYLPLPLHWHVQSLQSKCSFDLKIPNYTLPAEDRSGTALLHDEKNWATSFPSAHMWLQARDAADERGFCCAGGQILGLEAFLLGYRSKTFNCDFRPPFAVRFAGWSPFMSYTTDWETRSFQLSVQSFRQKVVVKASAPKGTFFSLSSPFPEGHRENYLGQSFRATIVIQAFESGWFSPWQLVHEDKFENASLEFGGGYYPPAGSTLRFH